MRRIRWLIGFVFMLVLLGLMILIGYDLGWRRVRVEIQQGLERPPTVLVFTPTPSGEDIAEATVSAFMAERENAAATENAVALTRVVRLTETPQGALVTTVLETAFPVTGTPVSLAPTFTPTPTPIITPTITPTASVVEVYPCVVEDNSGFLYGNHRQEVVDLLQEIIDDSPGVEGIAEGFTNYGTAFQSATCDFIIADYTVPGIQGPAGITEYKNNHKNEDIFVIGYSKSGTPNWDSAMELINRYVEKPDLSAIASIFETRLRNLIPS